jgi:signal transduction histidine kinase
VRDQGLGLSPEVVARIFDPFVRGPSAGTHAGGLGLGLFLSRNVARQHGGDLEAASDGLGRGTTMTLRLPLAGPVPTAPDA